MPPSADKQGYCERLRARVFRMETFSIFQCHIAQSSGYFSGVCRVCEVVIFG